MGHVEPQRVARGTGSEHTGVVLTTPDGEQLVLQRIGGHPFSDPETRSLAGHDVAVEGFRLGRVFRYTKADVGSGS